MFFNGADVTFWFHIRPTMQELLYLYLFSTLEQIHIFQFYFVLQETGNNKKRKKEQEDKLSLNVPESSLLNLCTGPNTCRSVELGKANEAKLFKIQSDYGASLISTSRGSDCSSRMFVGLCSSKSNWWITVDELVSTRGLWK